MEGLGILIGVWLALYAFRVFLAAKHPNVLNAMDEVDAKRAERNKNLAGGAVRGALGIAKILMKK